MDDPVKDNTPKCEECNEASLDITRTTQEELQNFGLNHEVPHITYVCENCSHKSIELAPVWLNYTGQQLIDLAVTQYKIFHELHKKYLELALTLIAFYIVGIASSVAFYLVHKDIFDGKPYSLIMLILLQILGGFVITLYVTGIPLTENLEYTQKQCISFLGYRFSPSCLILKRLAQSASGFVLLSSIVLTYTFTFSLIWTGITAVLYSIWCLIIFRQAKNYAKYPKEVRFLSPLYHFDPYNKKTY